MFDTTEGSYQENVENDGEYKEHYNRYGLSAIQMKTMMMVVCPAFLV